MGMILGELIKTSLSLKDQELLSKIDLEKSAEDIIQDLSTSGLLNLEVIQKNENREI